MSTLLYYRAKTGDKAVGCFIKKEFCRDGALPIWESDGTLGEDYKLLDKEAIPVLKKIQKKHKNYFVLGIGKEVIKEAEAIISLIKKHGFIFIKIDE